MTTSDVNKGTQLTSFVPNDLMTKGFQYTFEVPIYQRVFTWGEPEFERLISDLVKAFSDDKTPDYYLGAITVVRKANEENTLVLVDGQQRVTCIMLLGALFKWWESPKHINYEARPKDKESLVKIYEVISGDRETPVVNLENVDTSKVENAAMRAFFDYIKRGGADVQLGGETTKNIERFLQLGSKIKEHLRIFVSYLPDEPYMTNLQAQNEYFEKMNSGGKQLEPEDILKVLICGKLGEKAFVEWNAISDFSKCYIKVHDFENNTEADDATSKFMSQCQQGGDGRTLLDVVSLFAENHGPTTSNSKPPEPEDFGIAKNDQNEPDEGDERIPVRQGLIDFGIFLRHVLYVVKKEKGKDGSSFLGSLLDAFDKCENWDNALCKTFLGKMQSYRKFLDGFVIHLKDEGDANGYYFYHKDKKKSYRDSKGLFSENGGVQETDNCSDRVLQLQSLLYVTSGEQQKWLLRLYGAMQPTANPDKETILSATKECLSVQLGKVEDVDTFLESVCPKKVDDAKPLAKYGEGLKYRSNDLRLWLAFLDYLLWDIANNGAQEPLYLNIFENSDQKTMDAIKAYVFRRNRSVEHLHPQTDLNSANQQLWAQEWGDKGRTIKDFFGNLALISAGRNSEYSNESVGGKADRVRRLVESKNIESIKLALMLNACGGKDEEWNPECALEHAKSMLKVLKAGLDDLNKETK